jgi:2-polyprenyl-6-methoxyphenol hydroxylase-like FAD-dependent oxidoreductase
VVPTKADKEVGLIYDVVIAGAGPVGLFLACELRLAGRSVLVLEQAKDPHSPLKGLPLGLRGLWGPSTEAFYRRGLLNDLAAQSSKGGWGGNPSIGEKGKPRRPAGHFAGILFYADKIDFPNWRYRLQGPAAIPMPSDMEHIEAVLTARASALGVEIRRGLGVEGFEELDEEVIVHAGTENYRGSWLVGCDGGRSTVRKTAGFEFVGTAPEFTGYSLQVEMADPDKLPIGRHYTPTGVFSQAQPGVVTMVDFDGGTYHRTQPLTIDHVQAVLRRISGVDVTLTTLKLATTWTDRAHQTTTYRKGRVLLAGDAAHVHSPLGGQGLNLGFGDAMNLGWKLAATLRGDAPAGLLDTYSSERHPVGEGVLDWSRAQIALMRPSPASRALEAIVRDLIETRDGATYFAERVWGVSIRYDLGGGHPLTGRSAPDFELVNGTRLGELLQNGRGLLLDFDASPSLQSLGARWSDRITYVASDAKDRLDVSALLVRPDGFVAWAAEGYPNHEEAAQAALRWFGEPRG